MTTIRRKRREWTTTHSTNVWRDYLRVSNEKKKIINKEKKMKFRRVFRVICNISSSFWRFVRWTKSKNYRLREVSKIFDLIRRNQKIMFLSALIISISRRDFWSSFFFLIRLMRI
jgi:hypothetical protein